MKHMPTQDELEAIIREIGTSRKYRYICPDTIRNVVETVSGRYGRAREVIKAAKTKLHRVQAAYLGQLSIEGDFDALARDCSAKNVDGIKACCLKLMAGHASTAERIPILDSFYKDIFAVTGVPTAILDVACGVHPLSIPWMNLPDDTRYWAYEIDRRLVAGLNRYLRAIGFEPRARWQDVICQAVEQPGDLAFVMKMVPCLERRQKGCSLPLLERLNVRYIVVSFPVRSLSGRLKHMPAVDSRMFADMIEPTGWKLVKLPIERELVFVVDKMPTLQNPRS